MGEEGRGAAEKCVFSGQSYGFFLVRGAGCGVQGAGCGLRVAGWVSGRWSVNGGGWPVIGSEEWGVIE